VAIYVNPNNEFEVSIYNVETGLEGTLTLSIEDGQGNVVQAPSTTGIVESPAASGIYTATRTSPSSVGQYVLVWYDGTNYAADSLYVTTSVAFPLAESVGWAPNYLTTTQFKASLNITHAEQDDDIAMAIASASRAIDHFTNRQFGILEEAVAWYYQPVRYDYGRWTLEVAIDDLMDLTDLVVKADTDNEGNFETTLTFDEDFRLGPRNAATQYKPFTTLIFGDTDWRSIEVTARWGWTAVPSEVAQACLIQAARFFKRKDSPFGILGTPQTGSEIRLLAKLDPDVQMLLSPLCRMWGAL
jgi:hypothetical protein